MYNALSVNVVPFKRVILIICKGRAKSRPAPPFGASHYAIRVLPRIVAVHGIDIILKHVDFRSGRTVSQSQNADYKIIHPVYIYLCSQTLRFSVAKPFFVTAFTPINGDIIESLIQNMILDYKTLGGTHYELTLEQI